MKEKFIKKRRQRNTPVHSNALPLAQAEGSPQGVEAHTTALRDDNDKTTGYVSVNRDITERTRAQEDWTSEERFRSLIENSREGILLTGADGTILYDSPSVSRILGYSPTERLGKRTFEFMHPDERARAAEHFAQFALQPGASENAAGRFRHKDGSWICLEWVRSNLLDEPSVRAIVINYRDVTDRMRAEQALRDSEAQHRLILENINDIIYRVTVGDDTLRLTVPLRGGQTAYVSPQVEQIIGYAPDEFVQDPGLWFRILHPDDVATVQETTSKIFTLKQSGIREYRLRQKHSGEYRWMEDRVVPLMDEQGKIIGFQGTARDITERKESEEKIRESEERYRELFDNANDLVYTHDLAGNFTSINRATERITGYTREQALTMNIAQVVAPEHLPLAREMIQRKIAKGERTAYELDILAQDGRRVSLEVSSRLILKEGKPIGVQGIARDISERKRAQDALREREYWLEESQRVAQIGTYRLDIKKGEWVSTPTLDEIFGIPPAYERTVAGWAALIHPEQREEMLSYFQKNVLGDKSPFDKEYRIVRPSDGQVRWLHGLGKLTFDEQGDPVTMVGTIKDITERKRAEEEIRRRADEFEALHDTTRDLATLQDVPALLNTIVQRATRLLDAKNGFAYLYDREKKELVLTVAQGFNAPIGTRLQMGEGMAGQVAQTRQPMIVDDYHTWKHRSPKLREQPFRAIVEVPMLVAGELIGVLGVNEYGAATRAFTDADANLLSLFAGQAASAVHNARLLEETHRRAEQLSTLNEIGSTVSAQLEIDRVLEVIYQQVRRVLPLEVFYVALYDDQTNLISYPLLYDSGERYQQSPISLDESPHLQQIVETAQPRLLNRTAEQMGAPLDPKSLIGDTSKRSASLMFAPLRHGTRVLGMLSAQSYTLNAYTLDDLTHLSGIANQVAIAIANARLFDETERQLRRVRALHEIDNAISGSLDLRITLEVCLDQVTRELGVDAADVLRLDPSTQRLEFAAGRGFRTPALRHTHLRLGDGLAGRAALDRKMLVVSDLTKDNDGLARSPFIVQEGFLSYYGVPLIAKGSVNGVLEIFHRTQLDPAREWLDFLQTLAEQAAIAIDNAELYGSLQQANVELALAYDSTLEGWSRALDLRDKETESHTQNVTEMTLRLARQMGMSEADLVHVRRGALLHDIGKIGVPDQILLKPGSLNDDEQAIMRRHPELAFELLSSIEYLRRALDIPYCHHEKWDGTGYPRGLKGTQIPLAARIFAIVDVWDALRSDRPYRKAWSDDRVRAHLEEQSGKHFDPKVVEAFLNLPDAFQAQGTPHPRPKS